MFVGWGLCEYVENNYGSKEEEARGSKEVVYHDGVLVKGHINVQVLRSCK